MRDRTTFDTIVFCLSATLVVIFQLYKEHKSFSRGALHLQTSNHPLLDSQSFLDNACFKGQMNGVPLAWIVVRIHGITHEMKLWSISSFRPFLLSHALYFLNNSSVDIVFCACAMALKSFKYVYKLFTWEFIRPVKWMRLVIDFERFNMPLA